jgi:hypothetical protein
MPPDPQQLVIAASMPGGAGTIEERMAVVERASRNSLTTPRLEAWRSVGAAGQPAFNGPWGNAGGAYLPVQFYKGPDDVVRIRGAITKGNVAAAVLFTLPAGYRPTQSAVFIVGSAWTVAQGPLPVPLSFIIVAADGTVSRQGPAGSDLTWVTAETQYLDPISFRTT